MNKINLKSMDEEINSSNVLIEKIDEIINFYQQQKTELINKQAELNMLKKMLNSSSRQKGATEDLILGMAGTIGLAATGNIVSATIAGAHTLNQALDNAIQSVEENNRRIEEELKEQREWQASHSGAQNQ